MQIVAIEGVGQRLGRECRQQWMRATVALGPVQAAETTRIVESEHAGIVEHDVHVVVLAQRRGGPHHLQVAGHTQMQQQRTVGDADQKILGAAIDTIDARPLESRFQVRLNWPPQPAIANDHRDDTAPDEVRFERAPGGLDLRQFRHGRPI